jgi:hypothetical protein
MLVLSRKLGEKIVIPQCDSWIDLELGLWRALSTKIRHRSRRATAWLQSSEPHASNGQPVRLPS